MVAEQIVSNVITAAIGFFGVFLGQLSSRRTAEKHIRVEAITKERISWLDELRQIIADVLNSCSAIRLSGAHTGDLEQYDGLFAQANLHLLRLKLHLNPEGDLEKPVLREAEALFVAAHKRRERYSNRQKSLVESSRALLKAEWEKAKREAGVYRN